MEADIVIIGAGIVGLSIGYELSKNFDDIVIIEKESGFGKHISSRNSEVIHSGIYYPKNSLKAELCVQGNKRLYNFAETYNIPCKKCGKFVVATTDEEIPALFDLKKKGEQNGVEGLKIIPENQLKKINPQIKGIRGLWVPDTGIIDSHQVMKKLELLYEKNSGMIAYHTEVVGVEKQKQGYDLLLKDGSKINTKILINAAGLFSEAVSKLTGLETVKKKLKLYWCKGEYFKSSKIKDIDHLIYPLPDPKGIFLGIHLTINLQNEVRFGPNATYVDKINYKMDERYKREFVDAITRYIDIDEEHLNPDDVGIRPKLQGPDDGFRDFYIQEESPNGFPGYINLTGIESPGLTACLSIAEYVNKIVEAIRK